MANEPERQILPVEAPQKLEDGAISFSTAMEIIKKRKMWQQPGNSSSSVSKLVPVIEWIPVLNQPHPRPMAPSLKSLSDNCLVENCDRIQSLKELSEITKFRISRNVCHSQKMKAEFMKILVDGSPKEIHVKDCSLITETELRSVLLACNPENLTVLQLDICGRCMSNDILHATLARSPNSLAALAALSLVGAYRLSDVGLKALVASAPALRSINLGLCTLLTSADVNILADSLESLKELYIDNCENVDAMMALHALKKLEHLEVLSVSCVPNVCDDFVRELVAVHGPKMKKLSFSGCSELTDASLKVIAETCSGLCSLDVGNLYNLTDYAIEYLANGCRTIHTLDVCHNAFSDEAIAAFLEASGKFLKVLCLNDVKKVGHHTAISLAKCSRIHILDLSFCRELTDEALGLIVDNCSNLQLLKLFGCTQITNVFKDGHSNPHVEIVGLELTPMLKHLGHYDLLQEPLEEASGD
ncbi:dynein regulatory complex subunit 6-like [Telopea speciosissima]|uniref:dynein regulatory complex subunit 6-like n=1 Tax=Telopea speciosissima TaxID=54955 RepID=UPI001CC70D35|nr:dynein regulatory complex subunit 6-like [Telopea speciosissima]